MIHNRRLAILLLVVLVAATAGCDLPDLFAETLAFGLGAFIASQFQTVTVEHHCFLNGEAIDCAQLSIPIPTDE